MSERENLILAARSCAPMYQRTDGVPGVAEILLACAEELERTGPMAEWNMNVAISSQTQLAESHKRVKAAIDFADSCKDDEVIHVRVIMRTLQQILRGEA